MKFLEIWKKTILGYRQPRHRDKRGHYASSLTADQRDLYWAATGEPETNPTDIVGAMTMGMGTAVEEWAIKYVLQHAHFFGLHLMGTQVQVGGTSPVAVDGNLDGLFVFRNGETYSSPYVLEIKTCHGYGADLLFRTGEPKEGYLAQIGYYLKDLHSKGITNKGILLYFSLSDRNYGNVAAIDCEYDAATDTVTAYQMTELFSGETRSIEYSLALAPLLEGLKTLEGYIERKELPPQKVFYKHPLTQEYLDTVSDAQLKRAANGEKVLGDWQVTYSRYKQQHVEAEGATLGYSDAEIALLKEEILARKGEKKEERMRARRAASSLTLTNLSDDESE